MVAGDFDRANGPDLAVANSGSGNITFLFNDGDGGFSPGTTYDLGTDTFPYLIGTGELDGGGGPDLIVCVERPVPFKDELLILMNNGDGTFALSGWHEYSPRAIIVAEMDGRNGSDIVLAYRKPDKVLILLNNGYGIFNHAWHYTAGLLPYSLAAAELSGAKGLDLAVANRDSEDVSVLLDCVEPVWLLRNDQITMTGPPVPPLDSIFTGTGGLALDLYGPDRIAQIGEGALTLVPGSDDDDDAYYPGFSTERTDPEPFVACDGGRPLVFYQVNRPGPFLRIAKQRPCKLRFTFR